MDLCSELTYHVEKTENDESLSVKQIEKETIDEELNDKFFKEWFMLEEEEKIKENNKTKDLEGSDFLLDSLRIGSTKENSLPVLLSTLSPSVKDIKKEEQKSRGKYKKYTKEKLGLAIMEIINGYPVNMISSKYLIPERTLWYRMKEWNIREQKKKIIKQRGGDAFRDSADSLFGKSRYRDKKRRALLFLNGEEIEDKEKQEPNFLLNLF